MATISGPDRNRPQYTGEAGNKVICDGYYKQNGTGTVGDTVELFTIPAGMKVNEFTAAWSAGAATETLQFGWKYRDGSTGGGAAAFLEDGAVQILSTAVVSGTNATVAATAAGSVKNLCLNPSVLTAKGSSNNSTGVFDKDVIVYATNGTAAIPANQQIYAKVEGIYQGTL